MRCQCIYLTCILGCGFFFLLDWPVKWLCVGSSVSLDGLKDIFVCFTVNSVEYLGPAEKANGLGVDQEGALLCSLESVSVAFSLLQPSTNQTNLSHMCCLTFCWPLQFAVF